MLRMIAAVALTGLCACAPREGAPTTETPTGMQPAAADTAATPPTQPAPVAPAPETRIGTMNLSCGGETFRVAFENTRAVVVNADGSNTELPKLEPQPGAPEGVVTYTNGMITFTKQGGGDKPTVIKYAKARMAFQDCAITQN